MKPKFNYQILLSRMARNQFKLHNLKKEWKVFILFVFLAKILTWSISIFAGINYFKILLSPILQSSLFTTISAIIILIIIEVLTTIALAKFFKFLLRGMAYTSTIIALALVVFALFGLSFISSTNGLAMRQGQKADNTEIIIKGANIKKQAIKNTYHVQFLEINEHVATIKNNPQGWTRGVRSILLAGQLASIDSLQKRKAELLQDQKTELALINKQEQSDMKKNKKKTTDEAAKYYKIIMWVMIIQFMASGTLMFFWKRILNEDDEKLIISEEIKELKETMVSNAFVAAKNEFTGVLNSITEQLVLSGEKYKANIPVINNAKDQQGEKTYKDPVQITGFGKRSKIENKTGQKNIINPDSLSIRIDELSDLKPEILHKKNIDFLDKHKIIVRSIKLSNIAEKESISNTEIKQVQQVARRAKFKSKTLIREVYKVAVTIGFSKIDENGNVKQVS